MSRALGLIPALKKRQKEKPETKNKTSNCYSNTQRKGY
jgi:hypothetical protein